MVMPASDALILICQSQILLLAKSLEMSSAIVYLTESWAEPWTEGTLPRLYPVAMIPDPIRSERSPLPLVSGGMTQTMMQTMEPEGDQTGDHPLELGAIANERVSAWANERANERASERTDRAPNPRSAAHQLVLPLLHEEMLLGVLVAERDRTINPQEQSQIDAIRQTLTLACVMDRRSQWLDSQQQAQRILHRQQKDLMDNLLHQFRNPLTAMRTFGKLLMKRMVETDGNRSVASSIVRESDRLQALLVQFESAMDMTSEDESGESRGALPSAMARLPESSSLGRAVTVDTIDILTVLGPALRSARAVMDDRNQVLNEEIPDGPLWVQGDASALGEVFSNLLDNASKYTRAGGRIWVSVESHLQSEAASSQLQITITDHGYGIPAEDLPRLFERHFRGAQAQSAIPGTGLGLAIVRDLLRQMGGEIEIMSPPIFGEQGTTVRVTLVSKTW